MPPQDVYARLLLLSAGRGYPLWTPEPSDELLMQRQKGLDIGDVGVVLDDGGFDVFFNICLPPDHPFHARHGVPQGFKCIHPGELDIRTIIDAEPPGHVISSSSIMRETSAGDISNRHDLDSPPYVFNLSSAEGALLVLPEGAKRCDLLNEDLFLEQASRYGADWYNYAVNRRRRIIKPDSLYLITGVHKTLAWSVAAFENVMGNNHTAHFKQIEGNNPALAYKWETTTCSLNWRAGPRIRYGDPNQSVFIRGFKIAIRSGFLGTRWISVEADAPSTQSNHAKWTSVVPSSSSLLGGLAGSLGLFSYASGNNIFPTSMWSERAVGAAEERLQSDHDGYDGTHVDIKRIPDMAPLLHPSDFINRYLLDKDPSANIAITHDSHWISFFEDGLLTREELGHRSSLEASISQKYHIVSREGVVYLETKSSQLMNSHSTFTPEPQTITDPLPSQHSNAEECLTPPSLDMLNNEESSLSITPKDESVVYNRDWTTSDMVRFTAVAIAELELTCQWDACGDYLRTKDIKVHLMHKHGVKSNPTGPTLYRCLWNGCSAELKYQLSTLVRHIQECHGYKYWPCPTCTMRFSREGTLLRHLETCGHSEPQMRPGSEIEAI